MLTLQGPARADDFAKRNNEGNQLLKKGQFDEALQRYNEAKVERPDRPEVDYNIGNVYHLEGKLDSAAKEYQNALSTLTGPVAPNASYNLGNTYFRMQKYGPAVESYKQALIENPGDPDAKHNLELALRRLQADSTKQQQQKDQQNKSDSTQQKQDQKKDEQKDQQKKDSTQQNQQSPQDKKPDSTQGQPPPSGQQNPQSGDQKKQPQAQQPVGMTKEDAKRLLDALKNDELRVQRLRAQHPVSEVPVIKDW